MSAETRFCLNLRIWLLAFILHSSRVFCRLHLSVKKTYLPFRFRAQFDSTKKKKLLMIREHRDPFNSPSFLDSTLYHYCPRDPASNTTTANSPKEAKPLIHSPKLSAASDATRVRNRSESSSRRLHRSLVQRFCLLRPKLRPIVCGKGRERRSPGPRDRDALFSLGCFPRLALSLGFFRWERISSSRSPETNAGKLRGWVREIPIAAITGKPQCGRHSSN